MVAPARKRCRSFPGHRRARGDLLFAGVVVAGALSLARADTVVRPDGERLTGVDITEATWESVAYRAGDSDRPRSEPAERIEEIHRDSPPLRRPRELIEKGRHQEALEALEAAGGALDAGWEKAEAAYLRARALQLSGKPSDALSAYKAYLDAYREAKDWWVPHAVYGSGRCALDAGQARTAESYFQELASFGKTWEHRGKIGEGYALLLAEKHLEARRAFGSVVSERRARLVLRQEALLGRAEVFLAQEQYDNARQELQQGFFEQSSGGPPVYTRERGRATLLFARSYAAGDDREQLESAEIWFQRVVALYGYFPDLRREASEGLVALYRELGDSERAAEWEARLAELSSPETNKQEAEARS